MSLTIACTVEHKNIIRCEVCKRNIIEIDLDSSCNVIVCKIQFCSDKCKLIAEETKNNISDVCGDCGNKIVKINENHGFYMDFKTRIMSPQCDECFNENIYI